MIRWLLVCWFCLLGAALQAETLSLTKATARVFVGDDPAFADPDFDDTAWLEQPLYQPGNWQARGAGFFDRWYWMRIHLDPEDLARFESPAVAFGGIMHAIVTFNGVEIGRQGVIDAPLGNWRLTQPKAAPFVFAIPPDLIRDAGPNVLAIRVASGSVEITGIVHPEIFMAELPVAIDAISDRALLLLLLGTISPFIYTLTLLVSVVAWAFSPRGSGLGWLVTASVIFLPLVLMDSIPAIALDLDLPRLIYPTLGNLFAALVLVPILEFCAIILRVRAKWPRRVLQASVVALIFWPDFTANFLFPERPIGVVIWVLQCIVSFGLITFWAIRAARLGQRTARPIIWGSVAVWVPVSFIFFGLDEWALRAYGASFGEFIVPLFLVSLAWSGVQSLFDSQAQLAEVQGEVLRAQETERRRVAYDIHDGVGQWLSTIKLNLQVLRRQHQGTTAETGLSEVVGHVDEAISDTRRIAHDLSPAMIEKQGLVGAMQSHADFVSHRSDVKVTVSADTLEGLSATTQGHLYRIFQEAISNATKHGRATEITARLTKSRHTLQLQISDNGQGFDTAEMKGGLGLQSMQKRAVLIGADFEVQSNPAMETVLTIKINE